MFKNNTAQSGGAISLSNDRSNISPFILIIDSQFISNQAFTKGGAIDLDSDFINLTKNLYYNNKAIYGPNFSSFPCTS